MGRFLAGFTQLFADHHTSGTNLHPHRTMKSLVPPLLLPALVLVFTPALVRGDEALRAALTHHASFDTGFDADFSKGDPACYLRAGDGLVPCEESDDLKLVPDAGRFGGALWFPRKAAVRPLYQQAGILDYDSDEWSATLSLWLRLSPDEDLEPGYCDPIQIVGDSTDKGFIFLEWSKDHTPRLFRYAIRPQIELWNPDRLGWEEVPHEKRPMVELGETPFSRERWTHAAFTLDRINTGKEASGTLYLDGEPQGKIEGFDLTFGWDPDAVRLVLGAAYVGYLDDLAVFDRVLDDEEIRRLYRLENGVADLHR